MMSFPAFCKRFPQANHPFPFPNRHAPSKVHLCLKLLVAHLGAQSYTATALTFFDTAGTVSAREGEREMDLQLPGGSDKKKLARLEWVVYQS